MPVETATDSNQLATIPTVPRQLTQRIMRAYNLSPLAARMWFRDPCPALGQRIPAELAETIDGTRQLVRFLDERVIAAARSAAVRAASARQPTLAPEAVLAE